METSRPQRLVTRTTTWTGLERLGESFAGRLVTPGDAGYDEARRVWNATADRRPALVAGCATPADVIAALRFARDENLVVAVRGGGHSYPGFSTCDDGVVIDLGPMQEVTVDPDRRIATVQAGALLKGLDTATQRHGLVCPSGAVGHTGVAGLTLGGGLGRLMRRFGLTIDNLIDVDLVSADGRHIRASEDEHPDLFWGLRGAGANFGVVTSLRFRLHPAGPDIVAGAAVWPAERAHEVAETFRQWSISAPDDLTAAFSVFLAGDEFGPDLAGRPVVVIAAAHLGRDSAVARDLAPVRALRPALDTFARISYLDMQTASDDYYAWGRRNYWKGVLLTDLPRATVDILVDRLLAAPSERCGFGMITMGGAIRRVADEDSAFSGRGANWWLTTEALWDDPVDDEAHFAWGRDSLAQLRRVAVATNYVNDLGQPGEHNLRDIYGDARYERLVALKCAWDPDNVFRLNQNITP
jgi:FAD/FMN-containing dehydrogenase